MTGDDPESEWETHNATLKKNKRKLNDSHFDALRYTSSNGTDLVVGMDAAPPLGGWLVHDEGGRHLLSQHAPPRRSSPRLTAIAWRE